MDGTTPPKTSLLSQKLPGGQVLINSIQQKIRHASSIRDLITAMESRVNAGVISLLDLVASMEEHNVFLDKKECDVLDRRFTNSSGDLEYFRLIKTLDIGTPAEHMDPEHFEDILPQPYRMISKILEYEIMDVAWLEILRRHPEVAEDIPGGGGAGAARRNRNLDRECHPSFQAEKVKQVAAMGAGEGELSFSINIEGSFQIMDNSSGKVLRTLQLFPLEGNGSDNQEDDNDSPPVAAAVVRKDGSLIQRVELSNTSVGESPEYLSRTAVLKIEANLPKPEPEEDPASKKGGKKGGDKKGEVVVEETQLIPFKCTVTIVETAGKTSKTLEVRVLSSFKCMLSDSNVHAELSLDGRVLTISHGMTIEVFKLIPLRSIIDPLNTKSVVSNAPALLDIHDEDDENMLADNASAPLTIVPPSLCQWNILDEVTRQTEKHYTNSNNPNERQKHVKLLASMETSRVWRSFFFPLLPDMQWNDSKPPVQAAPPAPSAPAGGAAGAKKGGKGAAAATASEGTPINPLSLLPPTSMAFQQQQSLSREFQNGLVVFLEDVKAFFVFGLRSMGDVEKIAYAEKQKAAMDAAILAAGGTLDEGITGTTAAGNVQGNSSTDIGSEETESPLLYNNPPCLELITFWTLSDAVTAVDSDARKTLLVLGQADGAVVMWDLRSLQMIDVPAQHRSLITSVALANGSHAHSLVTGDSDGTLCFFNLAVPNAKGADAADQDRQVIPANQGSVSDIGISDVQQCVKAELVNFRTDFLPKEIVTKIFVIPQTPIVVVQLASMKLVAYDAESGELYGRMSLTSGIPGQRIEFYLVPAEDAVSTYTTPPLTEEEKQRLLEEAEEEAAKATKGKKGGKKEPAASQEELDVDMESLVAPEPSPYLVRKNRTSIACASASGFCGSFIVNQEKEVISVFSTERLITFFCAGVASILKHLALSSRSSFDESSTPSALDVYRALSKEERNMENLRPSAVSSLRSGGGAGVGLEETSATSKNTSAVGKKPLGRGSTGNNLLTEAKLKALQKTYSPFKSITALPPISSSLKQKIPIPKDLFEKSCKAGQADRVRRKKALLSRMEALSGMV